MLNYLDMIATVIIAIFSLVVVIWVAKNWRNEK